MGLQLPERRAGSARRLRRIALLAMPIAGVLVLSGCSGEGERLAMPEPATEQGEHILSLWQGAWIAALITGVVVWGLIFYAAWRFRRRSDDEVPIQTRYNLPLEIFYTIFPIVMVVVFFSQTVRVQNLVLEESSEPENTVWVVGQKWQWTFNYPEAVGGQNVYEVGTGNDLPTLVIPVNETTKFELRSPDVIHDFGVPGFLMKMDVVPGLENSFEVTPTSTGTYKGKCYELCGAYHSRMLFNLEIVPRDEYEAYLEGLADAGNTSDKPILGGTYACSQVGVEAESVEECP